MGALPTLGDLITAIVARYNAHAFAGPVAQSRAAAPALTVTVTDALTAATAVRVHVVAGDVLAPVTHALVTPATFRYSLDGGATYSATAAAPEGATAVLEAGLSVAFPAFSYPGSVLVTGDTYDVIVYGSAAVTSIIGEEGVADNANPPKLVWVPTRDTFPGPNVVGPHPQGRSVRTRRAGVDLHVWAAAVAPPPAGMTQSAANLRAAEWMLGAVLYAIHEEMRIGSAPDGNSWYSDGCRYELQAATWQTKGTLMANGAECVAELTFDLPIAAQPQPVPFTPATVTETRGFSGGTPQTQVLTP